MLQTWHLIKASATISVPHAMFPPSKQREEDSAYSNSAPKPECETTLISTSTAWKRCSSNKAPAIGSVPPPQRDDDL